MTPEPYSILFEPVPIGPLVARNRFFQVPHCNGMGYRDPSAQAAMRKVKAEGGWAVVCTEQAEIHPSSDITPFIELRIWDDQDLPALARVAGAIHEGGALAGIELCHNGLNAPNLYTRETPLAPHHLPVATYGYDPVQARMMTKQDLADLRRWHRNAVLRAMRAGYDVLYVYAGHSFGGIEHFLSPRFNQRTDEYGGSARNRMRLLREILEDTREAADGRAAVACRISVDEGLGDAGLRRGDIEEILGELGELPDLWDFVLGTWEADSATSRFGPEGEQEKYVTGLKQLTGKPVVGVGRFTSPDLMVRQVRDGILDFIGAARPSIADPFLPEKIRTGRLEAIRECIGCNICVSGDFTMSPIRCTQNPAMGEEFRRGWHPERIRPRGSDARILVAGSGPAGLEAARALGVRGYEVVLAEATRQLGGRVAREARLPGLAAWGRVLDYRQQAIGDLRCVEVYRESRMTAADIVESGFRHVAVATGATWRRDGVARWHTQPIPVDPAADVLTPDDLMAGWRPGRLPGAGVRRRPLLPGRRARRTAAERGLRGRDRHPGPAGVGLDREHHGGRPDPAPAAAGRRHAAHQRRGHRGQRGQGDRGQRLHRPAQRGRGRLRGDGHRAAARGRAVPGAGVPAGAGRDHLGPGHRRRVGAGHDRRRGLVRPPVRRGVRRGPARP